MSSDKVQGEATILADIFNAVPSSAKAFDADMSNNAKNVVTIVFTILCSLILNHLAIGEGNLYSRTYRTWRYCTLFAIETGFNGKTYAPVAYRYVAIAGAVL